VRGKQLLTIKQVVMKCNTGPLNWTDSLEYHRWQKMDMNFKHGMLGTSVMQAPWQSIT
jgi:hypothetical protein